MAGCKGKIWSGRHIGRTLLLGACWWLAFGAAPPSANAEIVTRPLGKDAKGQAVSGYVFQPGRSYRHRSRSSDSVFGGRRDDYRSRRGIDYGYGGYGYPYFAPAFYYYVPSSYCYPIRPVVYGGSCLSVQLRF
jgi:hypothetical protein